MHFVNSILANILLFSLFFYAMIKNKLVRRLLYIMEEKTISVLCGSMVLLSVITVFIQAFLLWFFPGTLLSSPWGMVFISFYLIGCPVFFILTRPLVSMPKTGSPLSFSSLILFSFMCFCMTASFFFTQSVLTFYTLTSSLPFDSLTSFFSILLFGCFLSPILEEIIFRKILFDKLSFVHPKTICFFSAFTFAVFHMNFFQFIYTFFLGFLFALLYEKTSSLFYPILFHIASNLWGSFLFPFIEWLLPYIPHKRIFYFILALIFFLASVFLFAFNKKECQTLVPYNSSHKKWGKKLFLHPFFLLYSFLCFFMMSL